MQPFMIRLPHFDKFLKSLFLSLVMHIHFHDSWTLFLHFDPWITGYCILLNNILDNNVIHKQWDWEKRNYTLYEASILNSKKTSIGFKPEETKQRILGSSCLQVGM